MSGIPRDWDYEDVFDTQDLGCGDFLLDLRVRFRSLEPGERLVVASRDAGAPIEVPAWCRLTGHTLHDARPPFYLIQKRNHVT